MDTMDVLLRDHARRVDADATIRAQAERITALEAQLAQAQSSNRALVAQGDELRAALRQLAHDAVLPHQSPPMEAIDELTQRMWAPDPDAVQH